jgi:dolichyl-phosphate-mannose-protein mannosyltransferase
LNDEQVSELIKEGSATFQTKYETRTRLVDAAGNEIQGHEGFAPEHPDAEGASPETKKAPEGEGAQPLQAQLPSGSEGKERDTQAKPASEANEATK